MSEAESRPLDNNASLGGSSHNFHESTGQQKKDNNLKQEGAASDSGQYPHRPGEPNCMHYLRTGSCGYGANCRYNHRSNVAQDAVYGFGDELPERDGEPDCGFFLKTGTCKYGSSCKYNHPKDRNGASPVSFNILGLPMRPEETPCRFYMQTGGCKFGPACKFHHPQPAVSGSLTVPIRAFPALPIPAVAYASMQSPQAYISMPVSPAHTFLHHQYPGNLSPVSSSSTYGSSFNSPYPERPNRPNCRYFMNYGTCKYGQDCKYNHTTERVAQMLPHPLNLLGLPVNPGQPLCASYITYGICQNGLTCKFHHQIGGYPGNGLGPIPLPLPMPIFNQPLFGRMDSTAVISSATSSSSNSSKDFNSVMKPEPAIDENQHSSTNGHQELDEEEPAIEENQHSGTNGQQESPEENAAAEEKQHSGTNEPQKSHKVEAAAKENPYSATQYKSSEEEAAKENPYSATQYKSSEEEAASEENQQLCTIGQQKLEEELAETSRN